MKSILIRIIILLNFTLVNLYDLFGYHFNDHYNVWWDIILPYILFPGLLIFTCFKWKQVSLPYQLLILFTSPLVLYHIVIALAFILALFFRNLARAFYKKVKIKYYSHLKAASQQYFERQNFFCYKRQPFTTRKDITLKYQIFANSDR